MTDDRQVHPADALTQQLDRVSSLVRTLGELYSPKQESFAAGNSFIAHGLVAVSTLVNDAQLSLDELNHLYDAQVTSTAAAAAPTEEEVVADDALMVFPPVESAWQPEIAPVAEAPEITPVQNQFVEDDKFAQSYLELLRKLTAAEVFAAEQQALAPPGSGQNLLPLLRSLREEFQKLHKVA